VFSYEVSWVGLPTSIYHIFLSNFGRFVVWITCSASTDGFHHFSRHQKLLALRKH